MKTISSALIIFGLILSTGGCVLLAGAGAGYVAHDEATEGDGEFDPLEDVLDGDDDKDDDQD